MKQNERTSFSLRDLLLFTTAMSVVLFASNRAGTLLPLVLPLGIGLAIFGVSTDVKLFAWMFIGGLLAMAIFVQWEISERDGSRATFQPNLAMISILGGYFGLAAGLLHHADTRTLGLWVFGLLSIFIFLTSMLLPAVQ